LREEPPDFLWAIIFSYVAAYREAVNPKVSLLILP
jgi:hypothetical protein